MPSDRDPTFLVDPELLVPGRGFETSGEFWDRLRCLPEYSEIARIGPWTRMLFDAFVGELIDGRSIYDATNGFVPDHDFYTLYGELNGIRDCDAPDDGVSGITIPDGVYHPIMGQEENRQAIQEDLEETKSTAAIVDHRAWEGFEGSACRLLKKLLLVDIEAGSEVCARESIRERPSFASIQKKASSAFPRLVFCDDVWDREGKLRYHEREFSLTLLKHLSILNDFALDIWRTTTLGDERENRMDALGVRCSPETRDTMKRASRRDERTFKLDGVPVQMDWHAKLRHDVGRMYFKVDVQRSVVVIGGVTDHFPTK